VSYERLIISYSRPTLVHKYMLHCLCNDEYSLQPFLRQSLENYTGILLLQKNMQSASFNLYKNTIVTVKTLLINGVLNWSAAHDINNKCRNTLLDDLLKFFFDCSPWSADHRVITVFVITMYVITVYVIICILSVGDWFRIWSRDGQQQWVGYNIVMTTRCLMAKSECLRDWRY